MKPTTVALTLVLIILSVSTIQAGETSTSVKVQNEVNASNSNTNYSSTSEIKTKVNLVQSGEGTSSVSVNGKEWKLEGPGEIYVDENSTNGSTTEIASKPTPTPEVTPTLEPQILAAESEAPLTFSQKLKESFIKAKISFYNFFRNIFNLY